MAGTVPPSAPSPPLGPLQVAAQTAPVQAPEESPELSLPYRRPVPPILIVASLNEPELPQAKGHVREASPNPPPSPALVAVAPQSPSSPAPTIAAAPQAPAAPAKAQEPKATANPPTPPAAAPGAKAGTGTSAKPAVKAPQPAPKNAASTQAIAIDSAADRSVEIGRNFSAIQGTKLEVPFEGTGWTYLGEKSGKPGIAYDSRQFKGSSLIFVLNPETPGDYLLRFQRQDSLRGISYEELVSVTVAPKPARDASPIVQETQTNPAAPGESPAPSGSQSPRLSAPTPAASAGATASVAAAAQPSAPVLAAPVATAPSATRPSPSAASAAPPSAAPGGPVQSGAGTTPSLTSAGAPAQGSAVTTRAASSASAQSPVPAASVASLATPEAALTQARSELASGHIQGALDALDRLLSLAPRGTDEAYILYARALESNGASKDIKRAYSYYKKLRDEYPESAFWDEASARADYIERHYFDIR